MLNNSIYKLLLGSITKYFLTQWPNEIVVMLKKCNWNKINKNYKLRRRIIWGLVIFLRGERRTAIIIFVIVLIPSRGLPSRPALPLLVLDWGRREGPIRAGHVGHLVHHKAATESQPLSQTAGCIPYHPPTLHKVFIKYRQHDKTTPYQNTS